MMGHYDSCAVKAQLSLLLYVQSDMFDPHFHRRIGPTSGGSWGLSETSPENMTRDCLKREHLLLIINQPKKKRCKTYEEKK